MTVRGVPELSQQPGPDPVALTEIYSEAGHKGNRKPHPYLDLPDLWLSPPRVLGERLGARYLSLLSIDGSLKLPRFRGSSGSARRHPPWPRNVPAAAEPSGEVTVVA